jgi:heme/copper-type cytochrome/quinol oxidase subunit 4
MNKNNIDSLISYNKTISKNITEIYWDTFNSQTILLIKTAVAYIVAVLSSQFILKLIYLLTKNNKHKKTIEIFSILIFIFLLSILSIQIFTIYEINLNKDKKKE